MLKVGVGNNEECQKGENASCTKSVLHKNQYYCFANMLKRAEDTRERGFIWCRAWKAEKDVAIATEKEAAVLNSAKHGVENGYLKPKHLVQTVEVLQCLWQNY